MVLRRLIALTRIFSKASSDRKPAIRKSIAYQLRNILTEDELAGKPTTKGTHDEMGGVNPEPFKMNVGITIALVIAWLGTWAGAEFARLFVQYLGNLIMDDESFDDDDEDEDDDANFDEEEEYGRHAVKMTDDMKFYK